jgi:hypothetical protein
MSEEKRLELRQKYGKGWDTWDPELLCSSLVEEFYFDDPALDQPVTADKMPQYMSGWKDRVKKLGGTGVITSKDRVKMDVDGAYITWHWWGFEGTEFEGSAVSRTTDDGVEYERITYYPTTPKF